MTGPAITAPLTLGAMGRTLRVLLVAAAILALATAAFFVGRVSVSSSPVLTKVPVVSTQLPESNNTGICQQIGHFRSGGC
jgi:hypothetical protein